jgi:hypothetical protein
MQRTQQNASEEPLPWHPQMASEFSIEGVDRMQVAATAVGMQSRQPLVPKGFELHAAAQSGDHSLMKSLCSKCARGWG